MRRLVGWLSIVILCLLTYPGSLAAETTVDADGTKWTVARIWQFETITGENQGYFALESMATIIVCPRTSAEISS